MNSQREAELKPCPMCGSPAKIDDCRTIFRVECTNELCGALVLGERAPEPEDDNQPDGYWEYFERSAINRWNTRQAATEQGVGEADIADATKWLDKYQQSYGEMYTDLGRFLDAEADEMPPLSDEEIDSAWTTFNAAPGLVFWDRIRTAILAKPTGGCVPEGLIDFAKRCLAASRDGCDCDGGDIHEWALECGLIEPYRATEPCGHDCVCAEVAGFPIECYRDSDLLATQQPPEQE